MTPDLPGNSRLTCPDVRLPARLDPLSAKALQATRLAQWAAALAWQRWAPQGVLPAGAKRRRRRPRRLRVVLVDRVLYDGPCTVGARVNASGRVLHVSSDLTPALTAACVALAAQAAVVRQLAVLGFRARETP